MIDLPQLPSLAEAEAILARWREAFDADWARCRHWIEAALEHDSGLYTIDDVERAIIEEGAHLWPGRNAAAVTEWWIAPRDKVLHLWLAGGDLEELTEQLFPAAHQWALERGATAITLVGRRGWEKVFAPHGFRFRSVVLMKDLRDGRQEQQ